MEDRYPGPPEHGEDFIWTDEKVEYLTEMYKQGRTANYIGKALGCSRNAVTGKAWRIGLKSANAGANGAAKKVSQRARPNLVAPETVQAAAEGRKRAARETIQRKKAERAKKAETRPVQAAVPRGEDVPEPESRELRVLDLNDNTCRWPEGESPYTFCGHKPLQGRPYCKYHTLKATGVPAVRRKVPARLLPPKMNF